MRRLLGGVFLFFLFLAFPSSAKAAILINEISPSTNPEWIELYNDGDSAVDLAGFLLEDGNSSQTDDITITGSIVAKGYLVFTHAEGWLNNGGDTIKLYNNASPALIVDQYTYGSVDSAHSVIRSPDGSENWIVTNSISNGSANPVQTPSPSPTQNSTPAPTSSPTPTPTKSPTPTPTKSPTPKPTQSPSPSPEVLGEETTPIPKVEDVTPTPLVLDSIKKKFPIIPVVFIGSGLALIVFAAVQLVNAKKSAQKT